MPEIEITQKMLDAGADIIGARCGSSDPRTAAEIFRAMIEARPKCLEDHYPTNDPLRKTLTWIVDNPGAHPANMVAVARAALSMPPVGAWLDILCRSHKNGVGGIQARVAKNGLAWAWEDIPPEKIPTLLDLINSRPVERDGILASPDATAPKEDRQ